MTDKQRGVKWKAEGCDMGGRGQGGQKVGRWNQREIWDTGMVDEYTLEGKEAGWKR